MNPRYLTKSKFKLAMECPTKLYYSSNPQYANKKSEDNFLIALAESGFQVGELAKYYYRDSNPIDLHAMSDSEALIRTNDLLQNEEAVIFEAAVQYQNLFLRADVLIKKNDRLRLIEVKSKSADFSAGSPIMGKRGGILSGWKPYIYDVAFQKFVISKAYPDLSLTAFLMLVDKSSTCPTDGLHQKFRIKRDSNDRVSIIVSDDITAEDLSQKILRELNVDSEIQYMIDNEKFRTQSFYEYVIFVADKYMKGEKINPIPGSICTKCEFKNSGEKELSLMSGFKECWAATCWFSEEDFTKPTVLDIWDFRGKDKLISASKFRMLQVDECDIDPEPSSNAGFSASERRWIQVMKAKDNDDTCEIDIEGLGHEMDNWIYPLHFIDFETVAPAIPFNSGAHPYQGMAFQFSHHILHENGCVEHAGQYINTEVGINPNLGFIRALISELTRDNGTIFRYAPHENTYLNMIYQQIFNSCEFSDRDEILKFIKSITTSVEDSREKWCGERTMVDLCDLVKKYYYDPRTNGSNSIKKVLPAILGRSAYLQEKYGKRIYGSIGGIKSLNFVDMQWIVSENGRILDPYTLLPHLFSDIEIDDEDLDLLFEDEALKEGGSASIAYSRMQFTEMSDIEREELKKALFKYCELDTLAMVMIVEAWKDMLIGGNYS